MRALSIRQPWAWLIVRPDLTDPAARAAALSAGLIKIVENRSWSTSYRGELLVQASKTCARRYYDEVMESLRAQFGRDCPPVPAYDDLERGGVVGVAEIVGCVSDTLSLTSAQLPWFQGEYGWLLANTRPLPFHPCKGSLSFFDVPAHEVGIEPAVIA